MFILFLKIDLDAKEVSKRYFFDNSTDALEHSKEDLFFRFPDYLKRIGKPFIIRKSYVLHLLLFSVTADSPGCLSLLLIKTKAF